MKLAPTLLTVAAIVVPFTGAQAAVLNLGNYTKTTDGDETFATVFGQTYNFTTGNVYVVMNVTFSNATNPGVLDTTASYGGYSHSAADLFGQNFNQSTVGVIYYGQRDNIAGITITPGTTYTFLVKYELNGAGVDGDTIKYWVNPNLGAPEAAPNDADPSRIWSPANISSDQMRFRSGNGSENAIAYTNVAVYSGGSTPFVVPEPSALLLGGLGALTLLRRSIRR